MGLENNCFIFAMRDDIRCTVRVAQVVMVAFDIIVERAIFGLLLLWNRKVMCLCVRSREKLVKESGMKLMVW